MKKQGTTCTVMGLVVSLVMIGTSASAGERTRWSERQMHSDYSMTGERNMRADSRHDDSRHSMQRDSRRHSRWKTISGQVENLKEVRIRHSGVKHLVVRLQNRQGNRMIVDLGPSPDLQSLQIREGDHLKVKGRTKAIRDHRVLFAHWVKVDGEKRWIDRQRQRIQGRVAQQDRLTDTRTGNQHLVILLDTPQDQHILVDLGPSREMEVVKGDKVWVWGPIIQYRGRPLVLGTQIQLNGQTSEIHRSS
jgi:hypothetical protein